MANVVTFVIHFVYNCDDSHISAARVEARMSILSMRLDEELDRQLAMEAERARKSRSEVVREALAAYLREREQRRFQDEIIRAMRSIDPDEARALSEEALPLDNESLDLAEPVARYTVKRKHRTPKT